jgi:hypothetical protein
MHKPARKKGGTLKLDVPPLLTCGLVQIDQGETFDDLAFFYMLFYDLGDVFGCYLPIPDAFGINKHSHANGAKADGAAVGEDHLPYGISPFRFLSLPDSLFFQDPHKFGLYLGAADLRTRLPVAHENVTFYRSLHHGSQLFELVPVLNKLLITHELILPRTPPILHRSTLRLC